MQLSLFSQSRFRFFSLGSGSSGNCYYLGTKEYGILIDAGIGIRSIKKALREYGVSFESIAGVLVTHDHADHIKTVGCLGNKHNIPVYTTEAIHAGILRSRYVQIDVLHNKQIIEKNRPFSIKGLDITAFEVPHDSVENVGYQIQFEGQIFVLVTDIGRFTDTIRHYANRANHLVVEANYDETMLRNGSYPYYLKERISSGMGHISNHLTAGFIAEVYHKDLKNIWLCHLSQENNKPELAYNTVKESLSRIGVGQQDVNLDTLNRHKTSGLREF